MSTAAPHDQWTALGLTGTPCVCGELNTWHPACYRGLNAEQVVARYAVIYRRECRAARRRAKQTVADTLRKVFR